MSKLIISSVTDLKGENRVDDFYPSLIGRVGELECNLEIGGRMVFNCENGKVLTTSIIKEIDEDDYGVRVITQNTIYVMDDIFE
jgi:hypothetical protein